jgi:hypothetical protein
VASPAGLVADRPALVAYPVAMAASLVYVSKRGHIRRCAKLPYQAAEIACHFGAIHDQAFEALENLAEILVVAVGSLAQVAYLVRISALLLPLPSHNRTYPSADAGNLAAFLTSSSALFSSS